MTAPVARPSISYVDLVSQHEELRLDLVAALERVLDSGAFVLGDEVGEFEQKFAEYCGTRYAVGVGNGTDAISLALRACGVGPGDEVITTPNSFLASASAIALIGARPVFVDVADDYNIDPTLIEAAITPLTKAILPIHLTGRPARLDPILEIARRNNLVVVEDAAQAVGAKYKGNRVGSLGIAGCFSFHPLKTLSACGDGGAVVTNDERVYDFLIRARNHGLRNRDECDFWSPNSRLDTVQAAFLRVKLDHVDRWTQARRAHAVRYRRGLENVVTVPADEPETEPVFHTFVIQADHRDDLRDHLRTRGIETKVHYPIPIHLQQAASSLGYGPGSFPMTERQAGRIVSLPVYSELTSEQVDAVVEAVRDFYGEDS